MGSLGWLTLACDQTLPLTTQFLWLGSADVSAEPSQLFDCCSSWFPGVRTVGLKSPLTTQMFVSITTLINLPLFILCLRSYTNSAERLISPPVGGGKAVIRSQLWSRVAGNPSEEAARRLASEMGSKNKQSLNNQSVIKVVFF